MASQTPRRWDVVEEAGSAGQVSKLAGQVPADDAPPLSSGSSGKLRA